MQSIIIALDITAHQYLAWYKGTVRSVIAKSSEGLTVQFPANVLQQFVTMDGIQGVFRLTYDEENKFMDIERIETSDEFNRFA